MKDDTTRYPRTMVVFAIVMLGTGVERYALPVLLSLSVASQCSMKIISTIGYVVVGLTMAAVVGEYEVRYQLPVFPQDCLSFCQFVCSSFHPQVCDAFCFWRASSLSQLIVPPLDP